MKNDKIQQIYEQKILGLNESRMKFQYRIAPRTSKMRTLKNLEQVFKDYSYEEIEQANIDIVFNGEIVGTIQGAKLVDPRRHRKIEQIELNEMEISDKKLKQLRQEMSRIAGEKVEVEKIRDTIYAFGSELATLRLFMKYTRQGQYNPTASGSASMFARNKFDVGKSKNLKFDVGKSKNLGNFFFSMELG